MKKTFIKLMAIAAMFAAVAVSCEKQPSGDENKPGTENPGEQNPGGEKPGDDKPAAPEVTEDYPEVDPEGLTATEYEIKVEGTWTVTVADEDGETVDWLTVDPMSGDGDATLALSAEGNETGENRSATVTVINKDNYPVYELLVTQKKKELPFVSEGDYEFLKAIVDGKLLGDATPVVENWYSFDPACFEGTNFTLNVTEEGKVYVQWIQGVQLTAWPEKMHLAKCNYIGMRDVKTFAGKMLPQDWNTPELGTCSIVNAELVGPIPEGLASTTPNLAQVYFDGNDLCGALPHNWVSEKLEVLLLANSNNHNEGSHRDHTMNNPGLGYMVPASFDVILNENRVAQGDKTQIKLGGTCNGNYIGFEKGWGQERYEKYAENAEAGNTAVWDDMRLLIGDPNLKYTYTNSNGESSEQDSAWAWYYSNLGYTGMAMDIPHEMLDWDQAAADAYTAKCLSDRGL